MLPDLHVRNTIYLLDKICCNYRKKHKLSVKEFMELDSKYDIIHYIAECPWVFDNLPDNLMVKEIEKYVKHKEF